MRQVFGWMMVVLLCCGCAAGGRLVEDSPDARLGEAQAALDEAEKLKEAGAYSEARARAEHALALREAVLGGAHPEVARCLVRVGDLYLFQKDMARAEPLLRRALAIQEAALGKSHPDLVPTLSTLAVFYVGHGLYDRAETLYLRALAIQEAALGKNHPDVAKTLNDLAYVYLAQGLQERAETLSQRALAILENALGPNHPDVARALLCLAEYTDMGQSDRAEPLLQRALSIAEAARKPRLLGVTLRVLGSVAMDKGQYDRAETLFLRALAVQEAALGKSHPGLVTTLYQLGNLYRQQGLYSRAEPLLQRALATHEAAFGKNHFALAIPLYNLACIYAAQGLYDRAEPLFQRALALLENQATPGKENNPATLGVLNEIARFYMKQRLYDRAEPLFQRALAIHAEYPRNEFPDITETLEPLGELYLEQGLYDRAEPLLQRSLSIWEAAYGSNHPKVAQTLHHLARLRLAQHRLAEALPLFTRSFSISEQRLRQEALTFSESNLASFLQYLSVDEQALYALLRAHPEDAGVRRLALSAVLLLKGRSLEETADISRTLYRSLGAGERDTFERLRGLRTRQASLSLAGPGSLSPAAYRQRLEQLATEADALETDLARRSAPFRSHTALPPPDEIVERVAASLSQGSALVEFVAYRDSAQVPTPGTALAGRSGSPRYLALVLFPDATTRAVDLGPAEPINSAAARLRNALANRDAGFLATAQELYRLAFQPLRPLLGNTHRVYLSTDGQLSLVPFAALHDGRGFLVDTFDFLYLDSGRELLPRPQPQVPSSSVFVLADPDFTASPRAVSSAGPLSAWAESSDALQRFFSMPRGDLPSSAWVPLPGTRQEARSIQRLLPQAQLFLGPEASKERLLNLPTPGILHLATHGFFLENAPAPEGSRGLGHFGALGDELQASGTEEPLLRSGLALAGARASATDASTFAAPRLDTTLVTALEVAGLNLWGTQLVVLSACDTGRGDVKVGQGVYGLRRSLIVAGAETVVMSLWKVNDDSTRQLMEGYYRNLLAGQGRASALREAMRAFRASHPHPHDWAPFIALGSDAPLQAITSTAPETRSSPAALRWGTRYRQAPTKLRQARSGERRNEVTAELPKV